MSMPFIVFNIDDDCPKNERDMAMFRDEADAWDFCERLIEFSVVINRPCVLNQDAYENGDEEVWFTENGWEIFPPHHDLEGIYPTPTNTESYEDYIEELRYTYRKQCDF